MKRKRLRCVLFDVLARYVFDARRFKKKRCADIMSDQGVGLLSLFRCQTGGIQGRCVERLAGSAETGSLRAKINSTVVVPGDHNAVPWRQHR